MKNYPGGTLYRACRWLFPLQSRSAGWLAVFGTDHDSLSWHDSTLLECLPMSTASRFPFLNPLPEKLLGLFPSGLQSKMVSAGVRLFGEGDRQSSLFVLEHGLVELSILVPGRGDVPILTIGPGELIAWSAVLGKRPMTCTAVALEDSKLIELSVDSMESLLDSDPQVAAEFYRWIAFGLSQRLTATRLQLLDLFQHPNA